MKSSFKKIQKGRGPERAFFGHPEVDAILGNSLWQGSVIVMEEDHPSTNYLSLTRYFVSHNYQSNQQSIIFDTNPTKWNHLISPILKEEAQKEVKQKSQIAWRYDSMQIKLTNLSLHPKLSFFDLSKTIKVQPNLLSTYHYVTQPPELYAQIQSAILAAQTSQNDTSTKKLLLASLPAYLYNHVDFSIFLKSLRAATRSSLLITLITVPPMIGESVKSKLLKFSDYYLQIGRLSKAYEQFDGSLTIVKEVSVGQLRTTFRGTRIWGLKCKKRQLRIEQLSQQPQEVNIQDRNDF